MDDYEGGLVLFKKMLIAGYASVRSHTFATVSPFGLEKSMLEMQQSSLSDLEYLSKGTD